MVITDIKVQQKNENKVSVFIDGKYSFSLTIEQLAEKKLGVGLSLTEQELDDLKKLSKLTRHYIRLTGLIYARPRSRYELSTNLKLNKLDQDEIDEILARLENSGLVDDEKFARFWVEGRRALNKSSKLKLRAELKQKGVSEELTNSVLEEEFGEEVELEALRNLIDKKADKYDGQEKLMAYLASKGFSYSLIKRALSEREGDDF